MGKEKGGFLSPKAIANRIKSKGLQKLRWYCQMCQKQCRDENGFKCHLTSESHQRQLLLFADNPDKYIDSFSEEFLEDFLEVLRRRCGTKRIQANIVYQEYISHKEHTHMNSTRWETLSDFVKWLGREGRCVVDETEKGWYITYIDRDPEAVRKMEAAQKKEKMEMDDEEKTALFIQQQIERAKESGKFKPETEFTELQRENEEEKVTFNLGASKKTEAKTAKPANALKILAASSSEDAPSSETVSTSQTSGQKRKAVLDEIIQSDEHKKEKTNRKDYWLHQGIVVKVVAKKLGDKYYKKKGVVRNIEEKYGGVVKMFDSGDKIRVDQAHLETVIPAIGKPVLIVNGAYRGEEAVLMKLDEKKFSCSVRLSQGLLKGRMVYEVQYEDISKLHVDS